MPQTVDLEPLRSLGQPVTDPTLNGPVGAARRWERTQFSLDDVRRVRSAFGGTVNDVLLTVCARAFRDMLLHRGEVVTGRVLRTLVPVAMRASAGAHAGGGNRISGMAVELPVGEVEAVECLDRVRSQTQAFKALNEAAPVAEQIDAPGFALPVMLTLGSRLASTLPSIVHTVTSNVPGPREPLYLHGRRLNGLSACISLWAPLRIAVSVLSYVGTLSFAVVADRGSVPDMRQFVEGAQAGMAELLAAADEAVA
jgi:diacylglycerol O-acyltransferase / wax synthase